MIGAGVVTSARVTHESGSVDDIAAASPESQAAGVADLCTLSGVEEAFVLSTCNRVEAYVVASDGAVGQAAVETMFAEVAQAAVVIEDHHESLRHLLAVAAGLESVVLGEDQILGQVRTAYEDARCVGGIGPLLETGVTKAIHVGERARTETAINEGVVSLGSAAARIAAADIDLEGATALVVGAGEMGTLATRSLAAAGARELIVANRTPENAARILRALESDLDDGDGNGDDDSQIETATASLEALDTVAARADVVVSATGSEEPLLESAHFGERPQVVVDLGQPRDVCPAAADHPSTTVYDLDDLETITARTREQRSDAAAAVEAMVDREFDHLCEQYKRTRADEVIATMYESAERIKERELETAFSRLEGEEETELTDAQRDIIRSMTDALVNQLLAPPTKSLREAAGEDDWQTISTALQLFDPDFGPEPPAAILEAAAEADMDVPVGVFDDD